MYDLVVRGGVLAATGERSDIGITDGTVAAVEPELLEPARDTLDASGLHLFPGLVDVHVHFNEPGRSDWEGAASGSAALAAGGGTLFADMPLNSDPPLLRAGDFIAKKERLEAVSHADFALWGGLTPDNVDALPELADCGVIGFKAFMSDSGIPEFKRADDLTLYRGMMLAAQLGLPVAVHAESEAITSALTRELKSRGSVDDYLASRPVLAELEAVNRALFLAEETGCQLHLVHLSSARSVALVARARARGVHATCETCPHYLYLSADDLRRLGAPAKCAPPLRPDGERRALVQALLQGDIDLIASDHSPAPPDLKSSENFFEVWGGVAGVQSTLHVLLSQDVPPPTIARLSAAAPAARFGLRAKGRLEPGFDADLTLVDITAETELKKADLFTTHKQSPYLGQRLRGKVVRTLLRGYTSFGQGRHPAPTGRFVAPG